MMAAHRKLSNMVGQQMKVLNMMSRKEMMILSMIGRQMKEFQFYGEADEGVERGELVG